VRSTRATLLLPTNPSLGQPERKADADGDGFPVQQPVGEAGPRLGA